VKEEMGEKGNCSLVVGDRHADFNDDNLYSP